MKRVLIWSSMVLLSLGVGKSFGTEAADEATITEAQEVKQPPAPSNGSEPVQGALEQAEGAAEVRAVELEEQAASDGADSAQAEPVVEADDAGDEQNSAVAEVLQPPIAEGQAVEAIVPPATDNAGAEAALDGGAQVQAALKPAPDLKQAKKRVSAAEEKVARDLDSFCLKWMGFLATRERDNRASIRWQAGPDGVEGEFVGYSGDYLCELRQSNGSKPVPVATIKYQEFRYQQAGASKADAEGQTPRVLEATEVTEIFRYSDGQWIY